MGGKKGLVDQYRAALDRVLASELIRHSDGLRRLLAYLGEKSLSGVADGLKEYTIGIEAFDKPPDYDPQQDPAVRVLASKLRHKLQDYYHTEGAEDPIRIEIPKGHYELKFQLRSEEAPISQPAALRAQVRKWRRISLALGTIMALLIAGGAYWLVAFTPEERAAEARNPWTPELEMVWQPFLQSDRPVLICLGTPLFTKFSGLFFRNPRMNQWEDAQGSEDVKVLQRHFQSDYAVPAYPFTGFGEATGAFLLGKLLYSRRPNLALKRSSFLSWDDVQHHNVVFLGSPKFNPMLKDLPTEDGFVIEGGCLRNLRPRPGEREEYWDVWKTKDELLEDYALIHRLQGLHGRGEIIVLASSSTEATWAAVEYVTQAKYAKELVDKLRLPAGGLPPSYQMVVRARFKDHVPFQISYVTHRVLQQPWKPEPVPASTP